MKFLVETISVHRLRYVIEADHPDHAADAVVMEEAEEFGQTHIGENILGVREISDEEIPVRFFEDHPYLSKWGPEKAFEYVTKIKS